MLKFVVLCALVAVSSAKPYSTLVLSPTLYNTVPLTLQPRYVPFVNVVPVVQDTPVLLTTSPYLHAIKKRSLAVLENAVLGGAAAGLNTFANSVLSANAASANAGIPQNQGQIQTTYPQQTAQVQNQHGRF